MSIKLDQLMIIGLILVGLAVGAYFADYIAFSSTEEVARMGDLKLEAREENRYYLNPWISGSLLGAGLLAMLGSLLRQR